ncbi:MAG: 2-oxoacid:ferredoxin oxidoreductase subunit beta [Myxococcota bacterium]
MSATTLTKKDFATNQEVRWCPGCGDYAILAAVQRVMPKLGARRENTVFVSGIGCSSRFPYYMNTFGFHTIHGRAPAVATGLKIANPELDVWVVTGDGDGLSIGGNHLLHALRRNVGLKILLFNNRIYGLTKGQYSPTSEAGKKTKSTPFGSIDAPFNPVTLALGANASFVARAFDRDPKNLERVLERAARHKGSAFVEIFQNCNVFNDGAFDGFTDKKVRSEQQVWVEHGKPLRFGKDGEKGIVLGEAPGFEPRVVTAGVDAPDEDLLVHDERQPNGILASILGSMTPPLAPMAMGVLRDFERTTFEDGVLDQVDHAPNGAGRSIHELIRAGDTWTVE